MRKHIDYSAIFLVFLNKMTMQIFKIPIKSQSIYKIQNWLIIKTMKPQDQITQWNKICNMRTTLLQLQYLYCSISQSLNTQSTNFTNIHKDRLIQYHQLAKQTHELTQSNFKVLLITKLESLLSVYVPVDNDIWGKLTQFINCVRYLEEEMSRDVCKLYVGHGMMVDIGKCEIQLKGIQDRIVKYLEENTNNIEQYNHGMQQIKRIEEAWQNYLIEIKASIKQKIEPHYPSYIRRRLSAKEKELEENIKKLQQFIQS